MFINGAVHVSLIFIKTTSINGRPTGEEVLNLPSATMLDKYHILTITKKSRLLRNLNLNKSNLFNILNQCKVLIY